MICLRQTENMLKAFLISHVREDFCSARQVTCEISVAWIGGFSQDMMGLSMAKCAGYQETST